MEMQIEMRGRLNRQDDAIRYGFQHAGIPVPDFFRAPDPQEQQNDDSEDDE